MPAVRPVRGDFLNEVLLAAAKQHIVVQSLDYELKKRLEQLRLKPELDPKVVIKHLGIISIRSIYFFLVVLVASFVPVFFSVFFTPHPGFPQDMSPPSFTVLFTGEDKLFPIECQ